MEVGVTCGFINRGTIVPSVCGRTLRMTRRPSRAWPDCFVLFVSDVSMVGMTLSTALPPPPRNSTANADPAA